MNKRIILFIVLLQSIVFCANAQTQDSTNVVTDSTTAKSDAPKPPKQKEIKKLEDPLLALSSDLIYRLKKMKPNQLLVIDERSVRNEKRVADNGDEYEVTITVRLGFSQDMITGIVREVPLYQSNDIEPYLLHVKIPVKFCCTTPIDTLHTKRHCGKMSELNDFEDNQHCKDWAQQDVAAEAAANTAGFGKPGGSKTSKKKGADVSGQTSATGEDEEGFGKPVPKGKKPTKKGKNSKNKMQETGDDEDETLSDSSTNKSTVDSLDTKPKAEKPAKVDTKKKEKKDEGFGKPAAKSKSKKKGKEENTEEADASQSTEDSLKVHKPKEPVNKKDKPEKVEKKQENDEEGFGKPAPKSKGKKKGKPENTNEETTEENKEPINETPTDSTALPNKKQEKADKKKTKKKE